MEADLSRAARVMLATKEREKVSNRRFAEILGRSEAWVRKMSLGGADPNYETLCRFIRRFRVDPRELFDDL